MPSIPNSGTASSSLSMSEKRQTPDTEETTFENYRRDNSLLHPEDHHSDIMAALQPLDSLDSVHDILKGRSGAADSSTPYTSPLEAAALQPRGLSLDGRTVPEMLEQRQEYFLAIPLTYKGLTSGPKPGTVVGIVLGSVFGFLLLFWFFMLLLMNYSGPSYIEGDARSIVVERRREHHSSRSRRTRHSSHHAEMSERHSSPSPAPAPAPPPPPPPQPVPPSPSPRRPSPRRETIIVEEETTTRKERRPSRAPTRPPSSAPAPPPPPPPAPPSERRVEGDDTVEVFEENTTVSSVSEPPPPPRRRSRRESYRTVDPDAYAGGDFDERYVEERRSSSRR